MNQLNQKENCPNKTSTDRFFGFTFAIVLGTIGFWPLLNGLPVRSWVILFAIVFAVTATFSPARLSILNQQWTKFGFFLHKITNPLVLGFIFLFTIIPIGIFMRLCGKDFLCLKRNNKATSYWIERSPPGPASDSFRRQF
jgi:hypothetical protein